MADKTEKFYLTRDQYYQLRLAVDAFKGDLESGDMTIERFVEVFRENNGVAIPRRNMIRYVTEAGVKIKSTEMRQAAGNKGFLTHMRMVAMEESIKALKENVVAESKATSDQFVNIQKAQVTLVQTLEALKSELKLLRGDISLLRGLCHHLYYQLNTTPPPGYQLPPDPKATKPSVLSK